MDFEDDESGYLHSASGAGTADLSLHEQRDEKCLMLAVNEALQPQ
jgi:hypothetical protein